jgi:hypothetical protein
MGEEEVWKRRLYWWAPVQKGATRPPPPPRHFTNVRRFSLTASRWERYSFIKSPFRKRCVTVVGWVQPTEIDVGHPVGRVAPTL